jgi:hypothetical protein
MVTAYDVTSRMSRIRGGGHRSDCYPHLSQKENIKKRLKKEESHDNGSPAASRYHVLLVYIDRLVGNSQGQNIIALK